MIMFRVKHSPLLVILSGCFLFLPNGVSSGDSDPCCGGANDFAPDDLNTDKWGTGTKSTWSFGNPAGLQVIFSRGFHHELEKNHKEGIICRALIQNQDFGAATIKNVGAYEGSVDIRTKEARKLVFIMRTDRKSHGLNFTVTIWAKNGKQKPAVECLGVDHYSVGCLHWNSYSVNPPK